MSSARLESQLQDAVKTDFFDFFNLAETHRNRQDDGTLIAEFKPAGGDFESVIRLFVILDDKERIQGVELVFDRSFVDGKTSLIFACDIAKSFVATFVPEEDEQHFVDVIQDIWVRYPKEMGFASMPLQPGTLSQPDLPMHPTQVYRVYRGEEIAYESRYSRCRFRIENVADGQALRLSFSGEQNATSEDHMNANMPHGEDTDYAGSILSILNGVSEDGTEVPGDLAFGKMLRDQAEALFNEGKYDEAVENGKLALLSIATANGRNHPATVDLLTFLGQALSKNGHVDAAERLFQQVASMQKQETPSVHRSDYKKGINSTWVSVLVFVLMMVAFMLIGYFSG